MDFAVPMFDPRNFEKMTAQPEIPLEKQRLAASLFGGSSSQKPANGGGKVANHRPGETAAPPRPVAGGSKDKPQPKQASSPLMDLMDMSEGDSFPAPAAKASYDPFKELEGLLQGPSSTAPTSTSAATSVVAQNSSVDFMSLFDSGPVVSQSSTASTNDSDLLSLGPSSSSGMGNLNGQQGGLMDLNELPGSSVAAPNASSAFSEKKGPSVRNSLQKDAASRQVGVTPTGANPALFQDLFG